MPQHHARRVFQIRSLSLRPWSNDFDNSCYGKEAKALVRQCLPFGQAAALGQAPYFRPCLTSFFSVEALETPRTENPQFPTDSIHRILLLRLAARRQST